MIYIHHRHLRNQSSDSFRRLARTYSHPACEAKPDSPRSVRSAQASPPHTPPPRTALTGWSNAQAQPHLSTPSPLSRNTASRRILPTSHPLRRPAPSPALRHCAATGSKYTARRTVLNLESGKGGMSITNAETRIRAPGHRPVLLPPFCRPSSLSAVPKGSVPPSHYHNSRIPESVMAFPG
jgi:hypothetical protein